MPSKSLREAIQEGLDRLELDDQNELAWQDGFRIARRIRSVLWEAGEDLDGWGAEDFTDTVVALAEGRNLDPDELVLQFHDCWRKVRFPEGQDPLTFAYNSVRRSDYRVPLTSEFPTETATEHAAVLATMAEVLSASPQTGFSCYLPGRKIALWLGRSHWYVDKIKGQLLADGTLKVVHRAGPGRCARMRYVAEAERSPVELPEVLHRGRLPEDPEDPEVPEDPEEREVEPSRRTPGPALKDWETRTPDPGPVQADPTPDKQIARLLADWDIAWTHPRWKTIPLDDRAAVLRDLIGGAMDGLGTASPATAREIDRAEQVVVAAFHERHPEKRRASLRATFTMLRDAAVTLIETGAPASALVQIAEQHVQSLTLRRAQEG